MIFSFTTRSSPLEPSQGAGPPADPANKPSDPTRSPPPLGPDLPEASSPSDDYLWDKTGAPDPDIVMLEGIMATLRTTTPQSSTAMPEPGVHSSGARMIEPLAALHQPANRSPANHRRRKNAWVLPAVWMAALLATVGYIGWPMRPWGPGTQRSGASDGTDSTMPGGGAEIAMTTWKATHLAGAPVIGTKMLSSPRNIAVDQWLTTDGFSRAQLVASGIGTVNVEPNSRVRLIKVLDDQQWFELAKGRIEATISAPPKLFFVKTQSALAVDMGCAYTLETDEQGNGSLHVMLGWVELQREGRAVRVPRGKRCAIREGIGPGTPVDDAASEFMVAAVERFDNRRNMKLSAPPLDDVLSSAGAEDGVTLWHVLQEVGDADRGRVIDKLASIVPPPAGISKDQLLKLDPTAIEQWWIEIRFR